MSADPCVRKARSDVALKAFLSFSAFGATVGRQSNAIETRVTVVRVLRQGVVQHRIEASFLIAVLSSAEWLGEKSRRNGDFPWITPPSIKMSNFPCLSLRGLPYLTFRLVFFFFVLFFSVENTEIDLQTLLFHELSSRYIYIRMTRRVRKLERDQRELVRFRQLTVSLVPSSFFSYIIIYRV